MAVGTKLGPYEILAPLGAGGMGEVYRASDTRLNRLVAIKVSKVRFSDRFEREARAIAALNHPNICTLYDVGPNYLVMEYIEGQPLKPPVPVDRAIRHAIQIADALEAAHGKGIVHRDIKPSNILITARGEAKVLDFGIARMAESAQSPGTQALTEQMLTEPGAAMGTTPYMSPEQLRGLAVDGRTDLWALGVVLYQVVTGARPFEGATVGMILESVLTKAPVPVRGRNPQVPAELERIISKCLEKDRSRRYQQASEVLADLRNLASRPSAARPPGSRGYWKLVAAASVVVALALAGYFYVRRAPKLTNKDTIVLADFDNKTGDPVFDDTLRQGLSVELTQSPFLSLISDKQVQQTLTLMGQPRDARLTTEIAQQICERTGSAAILEGSIASLGSQYVLGLRAENCSSGNILDEEQAQAAKKEDVLNSLSQIARRFRIRIGESLATVEKYSTPLAQATTTSLEALKTYSTAIKVDASSGSVASIPLFRRAVEMDSNFAMAYASLGLSYANLGEWTLSAQNTRRAWELRDRTSDREKFFIAFTYDRQVTGDLEKAFQTLELWAQTYPRVAEPDPNVLLAGLSALGTGRLERAIQEAQRSIEATPDVGWAYTSLGYSDLYLDRFDDVESTLQRASARKLEINDLLALRYEAGFVRDDQKEMEAAVEQAKEKRGVEHWMTHLEAMVQARSGRVQAARQLSSRAVDLARREGENEPSAIYQAAAGVWEGLYGNAIEAKRDATAALARSQGRDVEYAAALALAFGGDSSRSQSLAGDLEKRFPEDTFVRFTYVPVLRALSALDGGQPAECVDQLRVTVPYELAVNGLDFNLYLGGLYSAYLRGTALLAARRYTEAAAEFQKVLNHRGIVGADPIGSVAHLQLGRLYALSGDNTKAKDAYGDFLSVWKDADPDVPILRQAKGESAKLQ